MVEQTGTWRETATVMVEKDEVCCPFRVIKGGEWGQRLNGMEKRCDWLITVMEHVATTIGLFTSPPFLAHTTFLCTTAP